MDGARAAARRKQLADLRERFNRAGDVLPPLPCLLIQKVAQSKETDWLDHIFRGHENVARHTEGGYMFWTRIYQEPRCGLEGIVHPGLNRTVLIQGSKAGIDRFGILAREAGTCLAALDHELIMRESIAERDSCLRWVHAVFDLAWSQAPESLLAASKWVCVDGHVTPYNPDSWRQFLESDSPDLPILSRQRLRELVDQPAESFYSELADLVRASVHAIELLAGDSRGAEGASSSTSSEAIAGHQAASHGDKGVAKWTWQEAQEKAEIWVRRYGYPGLRELARKIGDCPPPTLAKSIKASKFLKARWAEHKRCKRAWREVQLSQADLDERPQATESDPLQRLVQEQETDARRDRRRARPRTDANTRER